MALLLLPQVGISKEPENSGQHVQPLRTEVEGNSPAPSQPWGSQDPTVPKRGRSALPCLVCPGRIPVPPRLMFSLFQTHLLNRTSLFFLEFPLAY